MLKQLGINYLLIVLDLCQPHYQVLLITYLKFTRRNAKHAKKEEKSTVCSYHVKYAFQSETKLYICLNVKEPLARNKRDI